MTTFVEEIISELESDFSEEPSIENWVMTSDGETVRINVDLWKISPVLREHSANGLPQKTLSVPKSAVVALIKAHEDGTFPTELQESDELLTAASELELKDLTSKCFDNIRKLNAIDESTDFPPQLSVETVMLIFRAFLDSPLRTVDVYRQQLSRIARYCANNRDVMTNAVNLLKQSLEKFKCINLEGLPIGFEARTVPVAIYERTGKLQTVFILGNELKPVNVFGDLIDSNELTNVNDFYLKYGAYLLYRRATDVYRKDLQLDSNPLKLLSNCYSLVSRGKYVFAAEEANNRCSILLWVDDGKFRIIFQCPYGVVPKIDFDDKKHVLAVLYCDRKLLLFKLENESLTLLEERNGFRMGGVILSEKLMFFLPTSGRRAEINSNRAPAVSNDEESQMIAEQPYDGTITERSEAVWKSAVYRGGRYLLTYDERLELVMDFPSSGKVRTLMTDGELCALSELCLY